MTDEKPPYQKPEALPLSDDLAGDIVGGGSGAADCLTGAVAFSTVCETGQYAQT